MKYILSKLLGESSIVICDEGLKEVGFDKFIKNTVGSTRVACNYLWTHIEEGGKFSYKFDQEIVEFGVDGAPTFETYSQEEMEAYIAWIKQVKAAIELGHSQLKEWQIEFDI